MSQTSISSRPHEGAVPSKRSCLRCNQRKVRCDRQQPCGRCLQAGAECIHPGNKRTPRKLKRPPIATILAHMKELEQEVEQLRSLPEMVNTNRDSDSHRQSKDEAGTHSHVNLKASICKPATRDLTGRYMGNKASVVLGEKIRELQDICDPPSDEESLDYTCTATTGPRPLESVGIIGPLSKPDGDTGPEYHWKQPLHIQELWPIYKQNVAPLIALLHVASIDSIIHEACRQTDPDPDIANEALKLAICFAAVVSVTPQQCLLVIGQDHNVCIRQYRLAMEQALARANLISTQDIRVLQAAVLFLLCLRRWTDSSLIWAEAAIVVRVAQRQGIHRDGQHLGLAPFDIEMRRRLWWHICILDMLCSEDQGTETQIRPEMFDTRIPLNIDGTDLTPDMTSLLAPRSGFTDITPCIIQCEMLTNLHWAVKSIDSETDQLSTREREDLLSALATRLEEQYLQKFDLGRPIQWVAAVIARLSLSKARLVMHLSSAASADNVPSATNDEAFQMAIEIAKFINLLQKNEGTAQWAWLCRGYKQQHVVAFILSELCVRPVSPETNHAWEVVTDIYNQWQGEDQDTNAILKKPLSRLMERATVSRAKKHESLHACSDDLEARPNSPLRASQSFYSFTGSDTCLGAETTSSAGLPMEGDSMSKDPYGFFLDRDWLSRSLW